MIKFISIFVGGGLGAFLRFFLGDYFNKKILSTVEVLKGLPLSTIIINVIGCFLLGVLTGVFSNKVNVSEETKAFLTTGFCGGFTTFSTFNLETVKLFENNSANLGVLNIFISLLFGIISVYFGYKIGKSF